MDTARSQSLQAARVQITFCTSIGQFKPPVTRVQKIQIAFCTFIAKCQINSMQSPVDELVRQSEADGFQLNESKCKELRISFSRSGSTVDHITINDKQIEVVSSAKLLGVVVSDNLRWNAHVESICKKAATCLSFLKQLKRAKVPPKDMLLFYTTCIRPVLEHAYPEFSIILPRSTCLMKWKGCKSARCR